MNTSVLGERQPAGQHSGRTSEYGRSLRVAVATGLLSTMAAFAVVVHLGIVPQFMHDDYEYTYPSFSLVRAGEFGSPLFGTGLNIEHRTYNFTIFYYATVHSFLIRLFGDRPESIPLGNVFHFALILGVAISYTLYRRQIVMGLVFVASFVSDRVILGAALAGRPEMTVAFGYFVVALMLYERLVWKNESPWILGAAAAGAVAAGLSHPAGAIVLFPIVLSFIVIDAKRLVAPRQASAFAAPFCIPVLLYAYFIATDDWRNITAQMLEASGQVVWSKRYGMLAGGQFGAFLESSRPVAAHFANVTFPFVVPGLLAGIASLLLRDRLRALWPLLRIPLTGVVLFGAMFILSFIMNWLFLKDFVASYTAIYRSAYYLALGASVTALVVVVKEWTAAWHWDEIVLGCCAVAAALYVVSHNPMAAARQVHSGFKFSYYDRFRSELAGELIKAGAQPGETVYCPSPFGTHLRSQFRVATFSGERYFAGYWPPSFDRSIEAKPSFAADARSLAYVKNIVFLDPAWIVAWDEDYSSLQDHLRFLETFPNTDPDLQIAHARTYVSRHTYEGRIHIFRVALNREFSSSLDRTVNARHHISRREP